MCVCVYVRVSVRVCTCVHMHLCLRECDNDAENPVEPGAGLWLAGLLTNTCHHVTVVSRSPFVSQGRGWSHVWRRLHAEWRTDLAGRCQLHGAGGQSDAVRQE